MRRALFGLVALLAIMQGGEVLAQGAANSPPELVATGLAEEILEVNVTSAGSRVVLFAAPLKAEDASTGIGVALIGPSSAFVVTRNGPGPARRFEFAAAPEVFIAGVEAQAADRLKPGAVRLAGLDPATSAIPLRGDLGSPEVEDWRQDLVSLQEQRGYYDPGGVTIERLEGGLRRASLQLPANAPPGEYRVRTVLFQDGLPAGMSDKPLTLRRAGIDATLHDLATRHAVIYGLLAVLLGAFVGGVASIFRRR